MKQHLGKIQKHLRENNIDAWVIYQFIDSNPMFKKLVGNSIVATRRAFLIVDKTGSVKIFHSGVDAGLGQLGFESITYTSYQEFKTKSMEVLKAYKKVAMEFSPFSEIPHISKVDAGIIDYFRSIGLEIVSSGDLMQIAGQLTDTEVASHLAASKKLDQARKLAFKYIEDKLKKGESLGEYDIQQYLMQTFDKLGLETSYQPDAVINENAAISHYAPSKEKSKLLQKGDLLLIDMWAKLKGEHHIYADITWMLFRGKRVPGEIQDAFSTIVKARDMAIDFLRQRVKSGKAIYGWEVDKIARDYIKSKGYGKYFTHRLGHSIGTFVHGELTHLDNFENKDSRQILPNHITSVEPGIYVKGKFGVRTEVDVLVAKDDVVITTDKQDQIYKITN